MSEHILLTLATGQPIMHLPLYDEPPRFTGGNATWTVVKVPRRRGFTNYEGTEPWTCRIKVLFDEWPDGDVERFISILEDRMKRPEDRVEPDLMRLQGRAMPHSDLVWVLTDIDDSGQSLRRDDGRRNRQELLLTFLEYVSVGLLVSNESHAAAAAARAAPAAPAAGPRTYTVRSGDTLSAIASRELGSVSRWNDIAARNGIRDPRTIRVGQVLVLP